MSDIIEQLRDDANYYGKVGRQYLSNSDVGNLLTNPSLYGVPVPDNPAFAKGRLFHQLILEPEKAADIECVNTASRNTKVYKDACAERGKEFMLLCKEMEDIKRLSDKMLGNFDFYDAIRDASNVYEEPAVGTIMGHEWKGKADILGADRIIDLKTTSSIKDFRYSARKYNYDSQCYIYQNIFGKPLVFYAIDKKSAQVGIYEPSDAFVRGGEEKVLRALEVYEQFFGENATDDLRSYIIRETL